MRYRDKTVILVGGASGIGESVARLAATEGPSKLVIYDRNVEDGERIAAEIGGPCSFAPLDVTDKTAIWSAFSTLDSVNPIDNALICAGVVTPCGILGRGEDPQKAFMDFATEFDRQTQVNLLGNGNCLAALVQLYVPRKKGFTTLIGSVAGEEQMANRTPYSAGKAGLHMLIRTAANDLYVKGGENFDYGKIVINGVAPARVNTALMKNNLRKLRELPDGEAAVARAMAKFRASQHSGEILQPEYVAEWMIRLNTDPLMSGTIVPLGGPVNFFE